LGCRGQGLPGPGGQTGPLGIIRADFSGDRPGKIPPASSEGDNLLSSWPGGNPTDASRAVRSGPRAPTEVVTPFFQNFKMIGLEKLEGISFNG